MGNVVLEALASGLAVVAPRAGGIPSLVAHDQTGLLYRPRDTQEAVAALQRVLSQADLRARLGGAARATVEQWGWNRSIARVRGHYIETIERCRWCPQVDARARRLAPAMVRVLVLAFRALAYAKGHREPRANARAAGAPVGAFADTSLNIQGGFRRRRPEGAGT
jgi:hypothetical protein